MAESTPSEQSASSTVPPVSRPVRAWSSAPLPAPQSSFVGRSRELARLRTLLCDRETRLLTLIGPGGVGKTRLATEAVAELAGEFHDGIAFVGLADVADPANVAPTIARHLEVEDRSDRPALDLLIESLSPLRLLLVLDNWEHLLPAAIQMPALLAAAPGLTILATSRIRLNVPGERTLRVEPLPLPEPSRFPEPALVGWFDAAELWVQRARAANPAFIASDTHLSTIASICRALDGLPLAIELAAAWTRLLSLDSIKQRLHQRLHLLVDGPRTAPRRQQTMRAAIAWSFDLLEAESRALLQHLSIFTGGFTADAAEAVWTSLIPSDGAHHAFKLDVPLLLSGLVDAALLHPRWNAAGEPRLAMLETVREFGLEQLALSGEQAAVREAHAAWLLAFAATAGPNLKGPDWSRWFQRIEAEVGNIRSAITWLHGQGRTEDALRLTTSLDWFWTDANFVAEGRRWYDLLLASDDIGDSRLRATALLANAELANWHNDANAAETGYLAALELGRGFDERQPMCDSLVGLAGIAVLREQYQEAAASLDEALSLVDEETSAWPAARIHHHLGTLAAIQGEWETAVAQHQEALRIWRGQGHEARILVALNSIAGRTSLGVIWLERGSATTRFW